MGGDVRTGSGVPVALGFSLQSLNIPDSPIFIDTATDKPYYLKANVVTPLVGGGPNAVLGPASAVDGDVVLFDGTTGKLVKDGGAPASFTATLTGCTTAPTITINYTKIGNLVTLSAPTVGGAPHFTATNNATTITYTGMPAALFPSNVITAIGAAINNGGTQAAGLVWVQASGVIRMFPDMVGNSWAAAGTASFTLPSITYTLA